MHEESNEKEIMESRKVGESVENRKRVESRRGEISRHNQCFKQSKVGSAFKL
jgi:hypothetical protein